VYFIIVLVCKYVKVKLSRYAVQALRGRYTAPTHYWPRHSVTPQPRFTPGKESWYSLDRRLGGPQSRSGHRGYRKKSFVSAGNRTPVVQSVVRQYNDWATPAPGIYVRTRYKCRHYRHLIRRHMHEWMQCQAMSWHRLNEPRTVIATAHRPGRCAWNSITK
jgi:hypothetical protein